MAHPPLPPSQEDEKSLLYLAHLSAPAAALFSAGWLSFLGPLIVWTLYRDRSPVVRQGAAGAFNFNVTITLVSWALWLSAIITFGIGLIWALPGLLGLFVIQMVFHGQAALATQRGEGYFYPAQIKVLS